MTRKRRQELIYSQRNTDYQMMRRLYDGDIDAWWDNNFRKENRLNMVLNYVFPIVEKHAAFLAADPPEFNSVPSSPAAADREQAQRAERALYAINRFNRFPRFLIGAAKDAALLGTAWAKTFAEKQDNGKVWPRYMSAVPEYVLPDLYQSVYGERIKSVIYSYQVDLDTAREEYGADVHSDSDLEFDEVAKKELSGNKATYIEYWDAKEYWLMVGGKLIEQDTKNKYGFIPYTPMQFLAQPGKVHGISLCKHMVDANKHLNLVTSRKGDSILLNCNPPIVWRRAPGDWQELARIAQAGGVWGIPGDGDVGFLSWPGEPPTVSEQQQMMLRYIFDSSFMPEIAFTGMMRDVTGIALKIGFDPLVKMLRQAQDNFGVALQQIMRQSLMLAEKYMAKEVLAEYYAKPKSRKLSYAKGSDIGGCYEVDVIWAGVLPKDDLGAAMFELTKYEKHIQSLDSTQENLGIKDPSAERDKMLEEAKEPAYRPRDAAAMLTASARALPALEGSLAPPPIGEAERTTGTFSPGPVPEPMGEEERERSWSQSEGAGSDESYMG
ncbi:MAG TPA: phage portal protein [Candidatus Methanomethylicus sp.]|nr:phage portal protein [Candidatus Methanomethylicus sp.]